MLFSGPVHLSKLSNAREVAVRENTAGFKRGDHYAPFCCMVRHVTLIAADEVRL